VDIHPLTPERLGDLAHLFGGNGITTGCWCMWFLLTSREFDAGWGALNRSRFEAYARAATVPPGLLAYRDADAYRDGEPVGWCATGPRARFGRSLRSPLLRGRDPAEDDDVWLVACLFVGRDARREGVTAALVDAAVGLAHEHGATAVEAVPLVGGQRHPTTEAYVGTEAMFAGRGFAVRARPSPRRLVMRLDLP
jgi:GNAT superfamily N-acetyltransferase